jgi:hypothetical protein
MERKALITLNIGDYAPMIREITYPLMRYFCERRGFEFLEITERKFPEWPVTYEKLQIHEIAKHEGFDWVWFIDADALVHPDTPDWTTLIGKDTVAHNGNDFAPFRWKIDEYFRRDGRHIGSCNWCALASDWCLDLWRPLDMTPEQAVANIQPLVCEHSPMARNHGTIPQNKLVNITASHLVDDYAISRNIARYGLKFTTLMALEKQLFNGADLMWHAYTITEDEKVNQMLLKLSDAEGGWGIPLSILKWDGSQCARFSSLLNIYRTEILPARLTAPAV